MWKDFVCVMLFSKCNSVDVFSAQPCALPVLGTAVLSQEVCCTCWCFKWSISATIWQSGRHNLLCGRKMARVVCVASLSTQGSTHVASGRTGLNSWPWENLQIDTPLPSLTWFSLGLTPCHCLSRSTLLGFNCVALGTVSCSGSLGIATQRC